jgi:hypothetical protein
MHLMQMADVAFCVVFRDDSYHRCPHPVHWDRTLPDGEHQLELDTFTGILRAGRREMVARERVPPRGENKTTQNTTTTLTR